MNSEEHRKRHDELHHALDELMADYVMHHPEVSDQEITIEKLKKWNSEQCMNPTPSILSSLFPKRLNFPHPETPSSLEACERAAGRADGIEEAAKVCAGYGREVDRLSKEYACETADELEARILALLKVPASSPARAKAKR